jgi:hypothetical protein
MYEPEVTKTDRPLVVSVEHTRTSSSRGVSSHTSGSAGVSSCRAERSINSSKTRGRDGDIGGCLFRRSGVGFALAF